MERDPTCLRINVLHQTSSHTCLICNNNVDVHRLTLECRVHAFVFQNIYIPENVRCCRRHLDDNNNILRYLLSGLRYVYRPYVIKGHQLQGFLQEMRNLAQKRFFFEDENSFTESEFKSVGPLTKAQFQELFTFCDPVPREDGYIRNISKRDLLAFLCKLRQGLSDKFLAVIFHYSSRQAASLAFATVRTSLSQRFVPSNIGFAAITRGEYLQDHITEFANTLYNSEPMVPKVIAYIDGTYSYNPKSSNFRFLRQTYSVHKGRHLVKPVLIVAPDGYILTIQGPYFADSKNNDANLLGNEFDRDAVSMREWFQADDILVLDIGYRDSKPLLDRLGINYKMPALLQRGQKQLLTEEANESRLVTKTRWIVEARNGHIKSIFKVYSHEISMTHIKHLDDLYRIAGAIINKYHPLIYMEGVNAELAEQMLEESHTINVVQARVEEENLQRKNARWIHLNHNQVLDFPHINLNELRKLTYGVYQINLAPSYIQDKLQREENEEFQLDEQFDEEGFIRVRIYSRFRNATKHQLWIAYNARNNADHENDEYLSILGYYCTCQSGARTLGSCVHISSVIWFLGYARHEQGVRYPSTDILTNVMDAAHRPQQQHPHEAMEVEDE